MINKLQNMICDTHKNMLHTTMLLHRLTDLNRFTDYRACFAMVYFSERASSRFIKKRKKKICGRETNVDEWPLQKYFIYLTRDTLGKKLLILQHNENRKLIFNVEDLNENFILLIQHLRAMCLINRAFVANKNHTTTMTKNFD